MTESLHQRGLDEARRRLAVEKRKNFWVRLFTLGLCNNMAGISTAQDHLSKQMADLHEYRRLMDQAHALDAHPANQLDLQGVRVSEFFLSDLSVVGAEGYPADWEFLREEILSRDDSECQESDGRCSGPLQAHHIVPLSKGGTNNADNLITLCLHHHSVKHPHMRSN